MSVEDANALQELFESQQSLTTYHESAVQALVELYRALREGDTDVLRARAKWASDRAYVPDPLGEKISLTFADMMFGEDPIFKSAETVRKELAAAEAARNARVAQRAVDEALSNAGVQTNGGGQPTASPVQTATVSLPEVEPTEEAQSEPGEESEGSDQDRLDDLIGANDLASELYFAETICSSEGEVWWRVYVDRGQSDYPIIEWHSRSHVRPLFRGRKLVAAAVVSEVHREEYNNEWIVYRYVEIHSDGIVRNLLYKGTTAELGREVPLTDRSETRYLQDEWLHDLGMLCGRIPNKLGRDRRVGISDYHNIVDLLFSLNEATTIGHENTRLTAKKRIAVPREALSEDGTFDAGEDVLVMDQPLDDELGARTAGGRFAVLEYSYDSAALIDHKLDLIATILSRVGIVAEFANAGGGNRGSGGGGVSAVSGTALRMRLIPTTLAGKGKGRPWDVTLPRIVMLAQQVDALPEERNGFGRPWKEPAEPPSVERNDPFPPDETEETSRHVSAVGGEIESRRTAIATMHPTWSEEQVDEELEQIRHELQEFGPATGTARGGNAGFGAGGIGMAAIEPQPTGIGAPGAPGETQGAAANEETGQ